MSNENSRVYRLYKLLSALKTSKAAGNDNITQKSLKDAADILAHSLTAVLTFQLKLEFFQMI